MIAREAAQAMPRIEWTDLHDNEDTGQDQLGMRVAGEEAYSQLLDFTTTVSWRPRYYAFLCWATERAFEAAGGVRGCPDQKLSYSRWQKRLRELDYAVGAASILGAGGYSRLAGSTQLKDAIGYAEEGKEGRLRFLGDHLKSRVGSLSIYLGPMRLLGLTESVAVSSGRSLTRPTEVGQEFASCFADSLAASGHAATLEGDSAPLADLKALGEVCGLQSLSAAANRHSAPRVELEALRGLIIPWEEFGGGEGPAAKRILSIGLLLRLHERKEAPTVNDFRAAVLLGGPLPRRIWDLPPVYGSVLAAWRTYQAHAYATYALESLLGYVLAAAADLGGEEGSATPLATLLEEARNHLEDAATRCPAAPAPDWAQISVAEAVRRIEAGLFGKKLPLFAEPNLFEEIRSRVREGQTADPARWLHDSLLMLLVAMVRLRRCEEEDGREAWMGQAAASRLPPDVLVEYLRQATASGEGILDFMARTLTEKVILQHRGNALRKLAAAPRRDTSRLFLEGGELTVIGSLQPGTSNPRFANAALFLEDLGYLDAARAITPDGVALLSRIAQEAGTPR